MQRLPSTGHSGRPRAIQSSKSFTRFEPQEVSSSPRPGSDSQPQSPLLPPSGSRAQNDDIFDRNDEIESNDGPVETSPTTVDPSSDLPPEIISMIKAFLESLSAKVHPTPLSIDRLSQLFQNFYDHANEQIESHIAILAARYPSDQPPTPSISSTGSGPSTAGAARRKRSSIKSGNGKPASPDQQMLTPSEVARRRKARRQLEQKGIALEEAVERHICEKVYQRIWRHRSTDDEERDEKLRSRAAALALVGVDLRELLSTAMGSDIGSASQLRLKEEEGNSARARLAGARESLKRMNDDKYPLGKLMHLKQAHKSIVETLEQIFPSSSSADEVLPTLIYTLITSDPDGNHIVSNFNFMQRFRASSKIDGEAAYCLTNLEAAITFLETVDLSSLRADETPEGPIKTPSQPSTPRTDTLDPMYDGLPSAASSPDTPITLSAPRPRGLSILTQPRQRPFEVQSDTMLKRADEALDTIHSALDGSFKFLFGHLKESHGSRSPRNGGGLAGPKTLEEARKLISSPGPADDDTSVDGSTTTDHLEEPTAPAPNRDNSSARVLQIIGGRRSRAGSVESGKSGESGSRKVSFAEGNSSITAPGPLKPLPGAAKTSTAATAPIAPLSSPAAANPSSAPAAFAVESMRNLGNTLNPLRGFAGAGMGMMRGFGRASSAITPTAATATMPSPLEEAGAEQAKQAQAKAREGFTLAGVAPPVQRFVECKDVRELNGYEVELLLRDYQRLTGVLRALKESERAD